MASQGGFFRTLRISILFVVLLVVGANAWLSKLRSTDWNEPLWVVIYPVNGDHSASSQQTITRLTAGSFRDMETWLQEQSHRYGVKLSEPAEVHLAPAIPDSPPLPPQNSNTLAIMWWSLKLRYWAWKNDTFQGPDPDVRIFVVYYDPAKHQRLRHSLGLQKGLIGVVNAFAGKDYTAQNNVVIVHEFLHTLGATDKYDLATNQPIFPDGFAQPDRSPLYPQKKAEIMAGRTPLSKRKATMPSSVMAAVVGKQTAREINWIRE